MSTAPDNGRGHPVLHQKPTALEIEKQRLEVGEPGDRRGRQPAGIGGAEHAEQAADLAEHRTGCRADGHQ
jgi:hypothetical protein